MSASPSSSSSPKPSAPSVDALPANHLSHPENWATGGDPATHKQQAFVASLEQQHGTDLGIDEGQLGKSQASEVIDKLKQGNVEGAKEVVGTGEKRGIDGVDGSKADGEDKEREGQADDEATPPAKKAKTDSTSKKGESSFESSNEVPVPAKSSADDADDGEVSAVDPTTTADGATVEPSKDTSTGAPAVTEANGDSRLDHPENWATGDDPATEKQLAYLAVLERQKHVQPSAEEKAGELGKTAASEKIERLKEDA